MKISNKIREITEKMGAIAGVLGVLAVPALTGNGCTDTTGPNCMTYRTAGTHFCAFVAGGWTFFSGNCDFYIRRSDGFAFCKSPVPVTAGGSCQLQNDAC